MCAHIKFANEPNGAKKPIHVTKMAKLADAVTNSHYKPDFVDDQDPSAEQNNKISNQIRENSSASAQGGF